MKPAGCRQVEVQVAEIEGYRPDSKRTTVVFSFLEIEASAQLQLYYSILLERQRGLIVLQLGIQPPVLGDDGVF